MIIKKFLTAYLVIVFSVNCMAVGDEVRGWIILSDNMDNAVETIQAAKRYNINQLQLSHRIIHDLREVKNKSVCERVNYLTRLAHAENIHEVLAWDHSFYPLDYYPNRFKTGPGGTIDLDNDEFWQWYKEDYRQMLDLIPEIDGIVLTLSKQGLMPKSSIRSKCLSRKKSWPLW